MSHSVSQCIAGLDGRYLEADHAYAAMLGFTPAELTARHPLQFTHPDDRGYNARQLNQLIAGGVAFELHKRYCRRDGSLIWVRNHISAFRDGLGGRRILATCRLLGGDADMGPRARWSLASEAGRRFRAGREVFGDGVIGSVAVELLLALYRVEAEGRSISVRGLAADLGHPLTTVQRWCRALIDAGAVQFEADGTADPCDTPVLLSRSGFARMEALLAG